MNIYLRFYITYYLYLHGWHKMPQTYIMLQSSEPYSLPSDSLLDLWDRNMREYKMNPAKAFPLAAPSNFPVPAPVYLMYAKGYAQIIAISLTICSKLCTTSSI